VAIAALQADDLDLTEEILATMTITKV
jgi:hypothetical protein